MIGIQGLIGMSILKQNIKATRVGVRDLYKPTAI